MNAPPLHIAWAQLFVRSAALAGVRDVVVSPGSRSTPLALAAHASKDVRTHFIVDERTAAFFALGQARVTGRPTMLVCTSGTAGAHYFPAVIEASMSHVPMLVVTADRPWEAQHVSAPQTIDQARLFGGFARMSLALGAPEPLEGALRGLARAAAQAVTRSLGPEPGPVHVNAPFRKPLEPTGERDAATSSRPVWADAWEALLQSGPGRAPLAAAPPPLDPALVDEVARLLAAAERPLVACGPAPAAHDLAALRRDLAALALGAHLPIFAEATSQLRFGLARPEGGPVLLSSFDALGRSAAFRRRFAPDVILELGAPPTSAGYAQLLADHPRVRRIVVAPHGWSDPSSSATLLVHASLPAFCRDLRPRLEAARADAPRLDAPRAVWTRALAAADAAACSAAEAAFAEPAAPTETSLPETSLPETSLPETPLTEAAVARAVIAACPPESTLVLGNSSPVRDADAWCAASPLPLRVLHQRGASGIDGLVSGAAGAASVSAAAVTLVLGDLSLLHDIGGLVLARGDEGRAAPLVIVAINNAGGRIFEQLPILGALGPGEAFEDCFATPRPIDLAAAAVAFGVAFERASTPRGLGRALAAAHDRRAATLIECVVPPHDGAKRAKDLYRRTDAHFDRKDES